MKKLLLLAGVVIVAAAITVSFVLAPPTPPPLDARHQVLADSAREGYCAGVVQLTYGKPTASLAEACRIEHPNMDGSSNLYAVVPAFCQGAIDTAWPGTPEECAGIMADNRYWPLYDGGVTDSWNEKYPYPLDRFDVAVVPDNSRTGERPNVGRPAG